MSRRTSEQAGLDDLSRDSGKLSEVFNSEDADIELLSKSGDRYLVHKANLSTGSRFFADMFSIASTSIGTRSTTSRREVLQMKETSGELDVIIPYFYPARVAPWQGSLVATIHILAAFDKFEIWRGIDAVEVYLRHVLVTPPSLNIYNWYYLYLLFSHLDVPDKKEIQNVIRLNLLESLEKEKDQVEPLEYIRNSRFPEYLNNCIDINSLLFWVQGRIMTVSKTYRDHATIFLRECKPSQYIYWSKLASCYTRHSLNTELQLLANPKTQETRVYGLRFMEAIGAQESNDEGPV